MNKRDIAESAVRTLLEYVTEEYEEDTPQRVVRAYDELFAGYQMDASQILAKRFTVKYDQMVILRDIDFFSTCEHHLLPFTGHAHVAYIPNGYVVGISKLARVVECFARRLQIQERMTEQIADAIDEALQPKGVAVVIEATHLCMKVRGIKKSNSVMITSALRRAFLDEPAARAEFMALKGKHGQV